MEVKVRIEAPELAQSILELAAAMRERAAAIDNAAEAVSAMMTEEQPEAEKPKKGKVQSKPQPEPASDEPAESEAPAETEKPKAGKQVTLETVRAKLAELSRNGKQQQVKELLGEFGATKLSGVDPKDYSKLMEMAEALG